MADIHSIDEEFPGVRRTLEVRKWQVPEFPDGKETFEWTLEIPKAGLVHDQPTAPLLTSGKNGRIR